MSVRRFTRIETYPTCIEGIERYITFLTLANVAPDTGAATKSQYLHYPRHDS